MNEQSMTDTVKILRIGWKVGLATLVTIGLIFGGLFLNFRSALATYHQDDNRPYHKPSPTPKPTPSPKPSPSPTKPSPSPKPSASPSPEPSPSPSPEISPNPTPTPPAGGDINIDIHNENINENTQEQTQEVNVTKNVEGQVAGVSAPAEQPETGLGVLGMASMFSAGPIGFALSRFGRGRKIVGKKQENLSELAFNLVEFRQGMSHKMA